MKAVVHKTRDELVVSSEWFGVVMSAFGGNTGDGILRAFLRHEFLDFFAFSLRMLPDLGNL